MKTITKILTIALAAICTTGHAQNESTDDDYTLDNNSKNTFFYKTPDNEKEDNNVYTDVDKKPEFPGGYSALYKFIADHLKYPELAKMKGIQGKVFVKFIIGKEGNVENPEVVKSDNPSLNSEAIRVVSSLPKWIPGSHNGKTVRVANTIPVNFKLDEQPEANEIPQAPRNREGEVFFLVEKMPEFPGGYTALLKYFVENTKYPEEAKSKKIQGKVFVQFIVGKDGNVEPESVKIVRGIDPLLDAEAIRMVKGLPKWEPGTQREKPVRVEFTYPIEFKL